MDKVFGKRQLAKKSEDVKKSAAKVLDPKRDTATRSRHLRIFLDNADQPYEVSLFFENHYSHIFYIVYDAFVAGTISSVQLLLIRRITSFGCNFIVPKTKQDDRMCHITRRVFSFFQPRSTYGKKGPTKLSEKNWSPSFTFWRKCWSTCPSTLAENGSSTPWVALCRSYYTQETHGS